MGGTAETALVETRKELAELKESSGERCSALEARTSNLQSQLEQNEQGWVRDRERLETRDAQVKMLEDWRQRAGEQFTEAYAAQTARVKQLQFGTKRTQGSFT